MKAEVIFAEALAKTTPAERAAYLNDICGQDIALRNRVDTLLRSHESAGSFLGKPVIQFAAEELAGQSAIDTTEAEHRAAEADDESLGFLSPSDKPESLGRLGHYEILEVVGRGGMGIVLRAFDDKLQRVVAIKVMAPELAATSPPRKRFLREARSAAAVRHEHVVDIHAVEEQPIPYLVMEYVCGETLQQKHERVGPFEVPEVLRLGQQIARGLAAAHERGLIHRDIKPSNILLEKGAEERVKITDFGLARAVADASLTQSGVIAGTPMYMAPEQTVGDSIDHRADLFSLGSVLYTMCSGRPPFRATSTMATLKRVAEDAPRPIREIIPEVPEWLCDIVAKLHAKKPDARFQSAKDVADLLGKCLAELQQGQMISGGQAASLLEKLKAVKEPETKPAITGHTSSLHRHNRRWVVAAAVLLLALGGFSLTEATGVTNINGTVVRIFTPEGTLVVETDDPGVKVTIEGDGGIVITGAGPQEVRLKPGSYRVQATKDGKPARVDRDLVTVTRNGRQVVRISREIAPNMANAAPKKQLLGPREVRRFEVDAQVYCLAISPDGRYMVSGGEDKSLHLWDVETGDQVRRFDGHEAPIHHVSMLYSGNVHRALSSGSDDRTVRLWDLDSGQELRCFQHTATVLGTALSPDGRRALTASHENALRLWDVESGKELRRFDYKKPVAPRTVAFSPDSRYAVSGSLDATATSAVQLWEVETGKEVRRFRGHTTWIIELAFSPDGHRVLSSSWDKTLRLWDVESGRQLHRFPHTAKVWGVAFSHDGRRALSGDQDGYVYLWDLETEKELLRFQAHEAPVRGVAFSPDGRHVLSGSEDGTVRLWELPKPEN